MLTELFETALFLVVLHWLVPPIVHSLTKNSWIKVPVMLIAAFVAGVGMAYVGYVPWLLLVIWLPVTHFSLKTVASQAFQAQHRRIVGEVPNLLVYRLAAYSYVVVSCGTGLFLQSLITTAAGYIPLWRYVFGVD